MNHTTWFCSTINQFWFRKWLGNCLSPSAGPGATLSTCTVRTSMYTYFLDIEIHQAINDFAETRWDRWCHLNCQKYRGTPNVRKVLVTCWFHNAFKSREEINVTGKPRLMIFVATLHSLLIWYGAWNHSYSTMDGSLRIESSKRVLLEPDILLCMYLITVTSHEGHGVSIYRQLDCLFNSFFRLTTKSHITDLL